MKYFVRFQTFAHDLKRNVKGQDMIEYALMTGFVALAAAALLPGIAVSVSKIFSRLTNCVEIAAGTTGNTCN